MIARVAHMHIHVCAGRGRACAPSRVGACAAVDCNIYALSLASTATFSATPLGTMIKPSSVASVV